MRRPEKTTIGVAIASVLWTLARFLLDKWSDVSTVLDALEKRQPVVGFIAAVIFAQWFGPLVAVGCLCFILWLVYGREWLAERHGESDLTLLGDIAPPSRRVNQKTVGPRVESVVTPELPKPAILPPVSSDSITGPVSFQSEPPRVITIPVMNPPAAIPPASTWTPPARPPTPVRTGSVPPLVLSKPVLGEPAVLPEGEFDIHRHRKGNHHYVKVSNFKAQDKENYALRLTDLQWYSPTLDRKGGFLTHEWFKQLKVPERRLHGTHHGKPLPHGTWDYFTLFNDRRIVLGGTALMLTQTNRWRIFLQFSWQNQPWPLLADVTFAASEGAAAEVVLFQGDEIAKHLDSEG